VIPVTQIILVAVTFGLIGYDIYVAVKQPNATISAVIKEVALKAPMIPFAFGVLVGHFFWPQ
jgi:hypothetical protein